jgi:CBS domain containing-hemolysin-like protein
VLDLFGRIPKAGEELEFQGLRFRAEEVLGRRIAKVLITRVPQTDTPEAAPAEAEVAGE